MSLHSRVGTATTVLALGAWLLAAPHPAAAQTMAATLGELETRVKAGATVVVETVDGRKVKGPLRRVTGSEIVLDKVGEPPVSAAAVRTVSSRIGHRPMLKGLLVGLGAGTCLGLLATLFHDDQQPCAPGATCYPGWHVTAADVAAVAAVGAGIGAGVGALLPPPMRLVYRASSPARVSVAPVITPRRRGVAVSVVF